MKFLVLFSNPPGGARLRLDREDRALARLEREVGSVQVVRQHASEVDDVHALLANGRFDVIQFSGHGSADGLYLDKSDLAAIQRRHRDLAAEQTGAPPAVGELVSAQRFLSLLGCAEKTPLLVVLLCCYSDAALETLGKCAPFVITSKCLVEDEVCIEFVSAFYDRLFRGHPIQRSFDHALRVLKGKNLPADGFRLSRRHLLEKGAHRFIECELDHGRESILVNLDAVADRLGAFGIPEEALCHMLARKMKVHSGIFDVAREGAVIPLAGSLCGVFSWNDARDAVRCTKLMKLRSDTPLWRLTSWCHVLVSYNDLASCRYRSRMDVPADESWRQDLQDAARLFQFHIDTRLKPASAAIEQHSDFRDLILNIAFVEAETALAQDTLRRGDYRAAVSALETALTNYHEIASGLQPPEEPPAERPVSETQSRV